MIPLLMPQDFAYDGKWFTTMYRQKSNDAGGIACLMNSPSATGHRYYAFSTEIVDGREQIAEVLTIQWELDPAVAIAGLFPSWPTFGKSTRIGDRATGTSGAYPG